MTNAARRRPAKAVANERPVGELKFDLVLRPPDGPTDETGRPIPQQITVDLRRFTLGERQLAKRVLTKFVSSDMEDVVLAHAWVVWRRTNPTSSLQSWMDSIEWGDLLDGLMFEPGHVHWDTTPEGYDPKP
jgi:hypothetical protein